MVKSETNYEFSSTRDYTSLRNNELIKKLLLNISITLKKVTK